MNPFDYVKAINTTKKDIMVDDIAEACIFFMNKNTKDTLINIGTGKDFSIKQYAKKILDCIAPKQKVLIKFDKSKPNGTPRKVLDVSLAKKYGWTYKTSLETGLSRTVIDYLKKNVLNNSNKIKKTNLSKYSK